MSFGAVFATQRTLRWQPRAVESWTVVPHAKIDGSPALALNPSFLFVGSPVPGCAELGLRRLDARRGRRVGGGAGRGAERRVECRLRVHGERSRLQLLVSQKMQT